MEKGPGRTLKDPGRKRKDTPGSVAPAPGPASLQPSTGHSYPSGTGGYRCFLGALLSPPAWLTTRAHRRPNSLQCPQTSVSGGILHLSATQGHPLFQSLHRMRISPLSDIQSPTSPFRSPRPALPGLLEQEAEAVTQINLPDFLRRAAANRWQTATTLNLDTLGFEPQCHYWLQV